MNRSRKTPKPNDAGADHGDTLSDFEKAMQTGNYDPSAEDMLISPEERPHNQPKERTPKNTKKTAMMNTEKSGVLSFQGNGVRTKEFEKLRKGKLNVAEELDLHGIKYLQAEESVRSFLRESQKQSYSVIRIIHGKGFRSADRPVLKDLIAELLPTRPEVLAFHSEPRNTGSVLVLLKKG